MQPQTFYPQSRVGARPVWAQPIATVQPLLGVAVPTHVGQKPWPHTATSTTLTNFTTTQQNNRTYQHIQHIATLNSRDSSNLFVTFSAKMSYNKPEKGEFGEGPKIHRIRITLTSRKVQALEKGEFRSPLSPGTAMLILQSPPT